MRILVAWWPICRQESVLIEFPEPLCVLWHNNKFDNLCQPCYMLVCLHSIFSTSGYQSIQRQYLSGACWADLWWQSWYLVTGKNSQPPSVPSPCVESWSLGTRTQHKCKLHGCVTLQGLPCVIKSSPLFMSMSDNVLGLSVWIDYRPLAH